MAWAPAVDDEDLPLEDDNEIIGDLSPEEAIRYTKRDSIIFLIDYRQPMHKKDEHGISFFQQALKLAAKVIKDKIICSEDDFTGVCLFGTERRKNGADFPDIFVFREMDTPDAPQIKNLEQLAEDDAALDVFGKPLSGKTNFQYALWAAANMFSKSPAKDDAKKVFIFTNDDNPVGDDNSLRTQAIQKAKDLAELDISVDLFPKSMVGSSHVFDAMLFYKHIVTMSDPDDEDGDVGFDPSAQFAKIEDMVARKKHKRRSQGRLKMRMAEGLEIGLKVFCTIRPATKQKAELLDKRTNNVIQVNTTWLCKDTGMFLQPQEIQQYQPFVEEKVCFTPEELATIKQPCGAGIVLLGFRPRKAIKDHHNYRTSNFVYPAEDVVKGSTAAFSALLTKCLELDVVPIVCLTARRNTAPKLAAMLPQAERNDGEIPIPGGFHVIVLPFANDIRENLVFPTPAESGLTVDMPSTVAAARSLVTKLSIDFNSADFDNPALQQHYATLEALALNEDNLPMVEDVVVPDLEGMKSMEHHIVAFRDAAFAGNYSEPSEVPKKTAGTKRSKPDTPSGGDAPGAGVNKEEWQELIRTDKIAKKTIPELKEFLAANGQKVSGKKEELIQRIKALFPS